MNHSNHRMLDVLRLAFVALAPAFMTGGVTPLLGWSFYDPDHVMPTPTGDVALVDWSLLRFGSRRIMRGADFNHSS